METDPPGTCNPDGPKQEDRTYTTPWKSGRVLSETQRARKREVNRITRRVQRKARRQDRIAQLELELSKLKEEQEEEYKESLEDNAVDQFNHQCFTLPMQVSSTSLPGFTPSAAVSLGPCLASTESCLPVSSVDGADHVALDSLANAIDAARLSTAGLQYRIRDLTEFDSTETRNFGARTGLTADMNILSMDTACIGSIPAQAVLYGW